MASSPDDKNLAQVAALAATLVANEISQRAALNIQQSQRDCSNWKWVSRWEQTRE